MTKKTTAINVSAGGPHQRHRLPAVRDHHRGRGELRDRRADVASPEFAQRRPLLSLREPFRDISDANRERPAGDADT